MTTRIRALDLDCSLIDSAVRGRPVPAAHMEAAA
jgi:hypothetical protein